MRKTSSIAGIAAVIVGLVGCDDFLTGPGLTENPNFPLEVDAERLLLSTQSRIFLQMEGQLARTSSIWIQQIAGINNQQRDYGSRYAQTELDLNTMFDGIYISGGLVDLRKLRAAAADAGNARIEGIAKILEAFSMGTYTSLWGDLPYREAAAGVPTPAIDPQEQIYADVQALLSDAIAQLANAPTTSLPQDLVYGGNVSRWIAAAHTLKARYFLHVAPRVGQQAYQNALTHANQGINEAPTTAAAAIHGQGPGDFRAWHGPTRDVDANIWSQFLEARADMVANRRMLNILRGRNDPRLAAYHEELTGGVYRGSDQFGAGGDPQPWSRFNTARVNHQFRQPFITWGENQLIKAEANFQLGNLTPALNNLNDVRARVGLTALAAPVTLEEIMVEKWIVQFQNIDAYTDWRRTCFPRLIPGGPNSPTPAARVPGRYVYGQRERQQNANFANLTPAQQPADNWNFAQKGPCPAGNTGGERYPA